LSRPCAKCGHQKGGPPRLNYWPTSPSRLAAFFASYLDGPGDHPFGLERSLTVRGPRSHVSISWNEKGPATVHPTPGRTTTPQDEPRGR